MLDPLIIVGSQLDTADPKLPFDADDVYPPLNEE
jgi:hypothetical protein